MHKIFFTVVLMGMILGNTNAQVDPHFSQYYVYPLYLNPALTAISEVDYRVSTIYRNQWNAVGKPFSTTGISADVATNKNLNVGFNLLNQKAGNGGYQLTNAYVSVAYTGIQLDDYGYRRIVLGLQGGIITRRFDPSKLEFGDQWLPYIGFNPAMASSEIFNRTSSTAFDAGAGIAYFDSDPEKKLNVFLGYSAAHITRPEDPFLGGEKKVLPVKSTLHGGFIININENLSVVPNFVYITQGNAKEQMIGAYAAMRATEDVDVMAGINYRIKDAVSPFVGLTYRNMVVGLSYDVNASELGKLKTHPNSIELSLTFTRKNPERNTGYFRCPRL